MDCGSRKLLDWRAKAQTAEAAVERALINRFGCLGRVPKKFKLRSGNGLVFFSKSYTRLVKAYGLEQEFITPTRLSRMI